MRSRAQELESKLSILENYSSNVPTYIKTKIDEPFYKAMDKVGEKLEALSIQKYKIPNTVGYKQVEPIKDDYQRVVGTKEVMPEEISINELYKLKNPYQLALQQSYSNYQNSKAYKEHPLTQEEYLTMALNTRYFEYVSIDDEKSSIEMWRDFIIGAGIVALYIFCPPAGAVTNTVFAGLELSSAVSGKDWGTGRELNDGERALRGAFALVDLIPAGKYLGGLAKTGKTAGITAVKTSLKTSFKEGFEQGAKNVDNFKGLWTGIKTYGDNMISQITTFSKPLDNLRPSKILSNSAEALSDGLRHADNVLSEATHNFRLNMGLEPQLVSGTMPSGGGKLTHIADNISAFAKNLDGSVDLPKMKRVSGDSATKAIGGIKPSDVDVPKLKGVHDVEVPKYNREQILRNIEESRLARESSKFDNYLRKEYTQQGKYFPERITMPNGKRAYLSADVFEGKQVPVRSRDFVDAQGKIKWPPPGTDGFVVDSAGNPITQPANLKAGQMIDRFGSNGGRFTSPVDNGEILPFNTRGLPYPEGYQVYHQYEVVKDITKENIVKSYNQSPKIIQDKVSVEMKKYNLSFDDLANIRQGEIAKVFGQGGGTQIQFGTGISIYELLGLLKEIA